MASNNNANKRITKALIDKFIAITGSDEKTGRSLLEACAGNLEMAIGMQLDGSGAGQSSGGASPADLSSSPAPLPDDNVRAPIPQKREVLVDEGYTYPGQRQRRRAARSVFDGFRDFQAEARAQQQRSGMAVSSNKLKTLEDLFRPPLDLMFKGSFHAARDTGSSKNRWLMVNIQNTCEFACQLLNRDVWANSAIKSIIKEQFIFWQVYNDSEEGKKYMQFYKVTEWPHVCIIDPRTGESLVVWNQVDPMTFSDLVTDFLTSHPSPDGSATSPTQNHNKNKTLIEESEDDQIRAAIQASLTDVKEKAKKSRKKSNDSSYFFPSDDSFDEECDLETFTDSDENEQTLPMSKKGKSKSPPESKKSNRTKKSSPTGSKLKSSNKNGRKSSYKSSGSDSDSANLKKSPPSKKNSRKRSYISSDSDSDKSTKNSSKRKKRISLDGSGNEEVETHKTNNQKESENSSEILTDSHTSNQFTSNSQENSSTEDQTTTDKESWKKYLGNEEDAKLDIMVRFPDGQRKQVTLPRSSKLMALVQFVVCNGFSNERYELLTNFPRRKLSILDYDATLDELGLPSQETVFVQER